METSKKMTSITACEWTLARGGISGALFRVPCLSPNALPLATSAILSKTAPCVLSRLMNESPVKDACACERSQQRISMPRDGFRSPEKESRIEMLFFSKRKVKASYCESRECLVTTICILQKYKTTRIFLVSLILNILFWMTNIAIPRFWLIYQVSKLCFNYCTLFIENIVLQMSPLSRVQKIKH